MIDKLIRIAEKRGYIKLSQELHILMKRATKEEIMDALVEALELVGDKPIKEQLEEALRNQNEIGGINAIVLATYSMPQEQGDRLLIKLKNVIEHKLNKLRQEEELIVFTIKQNIKTLQDGEKLVPAELDVLKSINNYFKLDEQPLATKTIRYIINDVERILPSLYITKYHLRRDLAALRSITSYCDIIRIYETLINRAHERIIKSKQSNLKIINKQANVEQEFLNQIKEWPNDDENKQVYADYLEEKGEKDKAEYLRIRNKPDFCWKRV